VRGVAGAGADVQGDTCELLGHVRFLSCVPLLEVLTPFVTHRPPIPMSPK
jgi:hypothetical protein